MDARDLKKIKAFMRQGYANLAAATVLMAKHHKVLAKPRYDSYMKMRELMEELDGVWEAWRDDKMDFN